MRSSILLAAASAVTTLATGLGLQQRESTWTVGQTVETSSGPVSGHAAKNDSSVSEYLGIRFAKAERWEAPLRYNGTSQINGSAFGPSCPVQVSGGGIQITGSGFKESNATSVGILFLGLFEDSSKNYDEDCLFLNVWTKPQVGDAKKAVMVWIYGGGFNSGSSSIPGYNGQNLAGLEDVVVVSFNYRLSVLGFPGYPSGPQNLGLLDQRSAIEWVRDNIEKFGGDSTRITVFGQSAGAASIDLYSYAYASDPIAAGLIPESGTARSWGLPHSKDYASSSWFNVTTTLGCGDASSDQAKVLSCMKGHNWSDVQNAVPSIPGPLGILGLFGPVVDDEIVFSDYDAKKPANVPVLLGSNNYEAGLFRTEFALSDQIYPDIFWDFFNEQEFTCPAGIRANVSAALGHPIWRYRYFGVWPDLAVSSEAGTYHFSEVPMILDDLPNSPGATQQEITFANYMRGAWAAFAKDPVKGLLSYEGGWPTYDPTKDTLIRLALNNATGTNVANPMLFDDLCQFVNVSSTDVNGYHAYQSKVAAYQATATASANGSATSSPKGNAANGLRVSSLAVLGFVIGFWLL